LAQDLAQASSSRSRSELCSCSRMALGRILVTAALLGRSAVVLGESDCYASGDCGSEESSLLAVRKHDSEVRRRLPAITCWNRQGNQFQCAGGDRCCGDVCVGKGDVCCENVDGNSFPCQGGGGQCCGNACAAPGSKCCKSSSVERSRWYPVTSDTECAFSDMVNDSDAQSSLLAADKEDSETRRRLPSTTCFNRQGAKFMCAGGDRCCGDICVGKGDVCCENVDGNSFPCQGEGGQCCGNACAAPGSKCCKSSSVEKSRWYPVTKDTECAFTDTVANATLESALLAVDKQDSETRRRLPSITCYNRQGAQFMCAGGDRCCGDVCVGRGDVCCENVNGNFFPCQGGGGQCCGNACAAPGSKCCRSPLVERSRWYPVTKATECAF